MDPMLTADSDTWSSPVVPWSCLKSRRNKGSINVKRFIRYLDLTAILVVLRMMNCTNRPTGMLLVRIQGYTMMV